MNYYAIQTKENRELSVKEDILKRIKEIKIFIPISKVKTKSGNHLAVSYERSLRDYLIVECEGCIEKLKRIAKLDSIENLLLEDMPLKEVRRFLKEEEKEDYEAEITEGANSGETGKIVRFEEDYVIVQVQNKNKVKVPIWNIEQKIAIDDLMGGLK